jgi:hypothetical protein
MVAAKRKVAKYNRTQHGCKAPELYSRANAEGYSGTLLNNGCVSSLLGEAYLGSSCIAWRRKGGALVARMLL